MLNKTEISAVHKTKLRGFLEKLELWGQLQNGEIRCAICEGVVSLENIGLIIPSGNEILVCCSKAECLFKAGKLRRASNES